MGPDGSARDLTLGRTHTTLPGFPVFLWEFPPSFVRCAIPRLGLMYVRSESRHQDAVAHESIGQRLTERRPDTTPTQTPFLLHVSTPLRAPIPFRSLRDPHSNFPGGFLRSHFYCNVLLFHKNFLVLITVFLGISWYIDSKFISVLSHPSTFSFTLFPGLYSVATATTLPLDRSYTLPLSCPFFLGRVGGRPSTSGSLGSTGTSLGDLSVVLGSCLPSL